MPDTMDKAESQPESGEENADSEKKGFFRKLAAGLTKTRKNLNDGFDRLIGDHARLDDDFLDELEELLITADIGVHIATEIVSKLRFDVKKNLLRDRSEVVEFVKKGLVDIVSHNPEDIAPHREKPHVILVIGVNGSGKTTTIGKMTSKMASEGKSVLLVAADTFRAAAIEQLDEWANRSSADFVRGRPGGDPSAVVFDGLKAAIARGHDVMIADTAGRLHNKANLMEELKKIKRIMGREHEGAPHETLLVLDAGTGQNGVNQAKMFHEHIGITGIVLTKLDGTAKGGVVINIMEELKLPIKMIGVGEGIDDLRPFDAKEFIDAMFTRHHL